VIHSTRAAFLVGLIVAGSATVSSADERSAVLAGGGVDCLTCPAEINVSADPFSCSAVVEFSIASTCPDAVTCDFASGSRFNVGSTQVYCNAGTADACTFNVVVTPGCGCGICGIGAPMMLNGVGLALLAAKCTSRRNRLGPRHS